MIGGINKMLRNLASLKGKGEFEKVLYPFSLISFSLAFNKSSLLP
jgi:hypothetical protein